MTFPGRIWRVVWLDVSVYREVAQDGSATQQAVFIYVFPALVAGLVGFLSTKEAAPFTNLGYAVLWAPAALVSLTSTLRWSGRQIIDRRINYGNLFRAMGFASVPTMGAATIVTISNFVEFGLDLAILGLGLIWFVVGAVQATKTVYDCSAWQAARVLLGAQAFYIAMSLRALHRLKIHASVEGNMAEPDESFQERREANRNRYRQPKGWGRFRR